MPHHRTPATHQQSNHSCPSLCPIFQLLFQQNYPAVAWMHLLSYSRMWACLVYLLEESSCCHQPRTIHWCLSAVDGRRHSLCFGNCTSFQMWILSWHYLKRKSNWNAKDRLGSEYPYCVGHGQLAQGQAFTNITNLYALALQNVGTLQGPQMRPNPCIFPGKSSCHWTNPNLQIYSRAPSKKESSDVCHIFRGIS